MGDPGQKFRVKQKLAFFKKNKFPSKNFLVLLKYNRFGPYLSKTRKNFKLSVTNLAGSLE